MKKVHTMVLVIVGMLVAALALAGPAAAKDRNNDKIPDRWEKRYDLSLKVNQAKRDQDRDGLNNKGEYRSDSDPRSDDTDDDGTEDGDENAGVITEFDGTTLTIELYGGGTVSGAIDEETEVKCGEECDQDGVEDEEDGVEDEEGVEDEGDGVEDEEDGVEDDEEDGEHHGHHSDRHGDNSGPGSEHSGDDSEVSDCSVEDLVVGAIVHEAELELSNGSARFEEIELAE